MKKLYVYLFLVFFVLQTPSSSDDIRDFQIEGMSIGDSLLDYFSEKEIKGWHKTFYSGSKKIYLIESGASNSSFELYDDVGFHIKNNDKKYIIKGIAGIIYFIAQSCHLNISKHDVNFISEISEVTINKCYKKLVLLQKTKSTSLIPSVILKKYKA